MKTEGFDFKVPEDLAQHLEANQIYSEFDLFNFYENHPLKGNLVEFGTEISKRRMDIKMFLFYQLHNCFPIFHFFEYTTTKEQIKLLRKGIIDERSLKAYGQKYGTKNIQTSNNLWNVYINSIVKNDLLSVQQFHNLFDSRTVNILKQNDIHCPVDLLLEYKNTKLNMPRCGKKTKGILVDFLKKHFQIEI